VAAGPGTPWPRSGDGTQRPGGLAARAAPPALLTGKHVRLRRLFDPVRGSCVIVALDHGMTSPRFLSGLAAMRARIGEAVAGGANALMLGPGSAAHYWEAFAGRSALALMLTASAAGRPGGPRVTRIGSLEQAVRLGADAVVVYVALAGEDEGEMISYLSEVGEACERTGMPLIAEAEFPNAYAAHEAGQASASELGAEYLRRNARLCAELGADVVKVNWSGDAASFASIVEACDRPVVLAGGPVLPDEETLARMVAARDAGAIGCSVGRNVFEHERPEAMTRALVAVFRDGCSVKEALDLVRGGSRARERAAAHPRPDRA
jgi:DhnA family fructose-bisphosphate aldolase class Ia